MLACKQSYGVKRTNGETDMPTLDSSSRAEADMATIHPDMMYLSSTYHAKDLDRCKATKHQ